MTLNEYKIPYPYNNYLNSIYYFECRNPEYSLFLPDGHLELMVTDCPISVSNVIKEIIDPTKILLWGQLRFYGHVNALNPYKVCGVKFHPWTLSLLSQNHSIDLVDTIIDGKIVFSDIFIDQIKLLAKIDWKCDKQKLSASKRISQLFLNECRSSIVIKYNFIKIASLVKQQNGIQSLNKLLPDYNQSVRTLGNDFIKYMGITPKEYQTIVRLRKSSLEIKKGKNILHTALDFGYFDNAHFTKEFKRFTGFTPKQFSTQKNLVVSTI